MAERENEEITPPKELRDIINMVTAFNAAVDRMKPPQQKALEMAMEKAMTDKLVNVLTGGERKETSAWSSIASAFASGLGQSAPELVNTLVSRLGEERTRQIVDTAILRQQQTRQEAMQTQQLQQEQAQAQENPVANTIRNVDLNNRENVLAAAQQLGIKFQNYENVVNYLRIMKEELALRDAQSTAAAQTQTQQEQAQVEQIRVDTSRLEQRLQSQIETRMDSIANIITQKMTDIEKQFLRSADQRSVESEGRRERTPRLRRIQVEGDEDR